MRLLSFLAISTGLGRGHVKVYAAHECAYTVSSHKYSPIPEKLALKNVVVIHRHGDRAQISREIGPNHPEKPEIREIWQSKLPSEEALLAMAAAAEIPSEHLDSDVQKQLYTGWDHSNSPYGQLTQLGSQQLFSVGAELRRRYLGLVLPDSLSEASKTLYCRSTNFCRTHQSLRSLLAGLLEVDSSHYPQPENVVLPSIFSKPKERETMYPQADGPCPRMNEIRSTIFANDYMAKSIPGYKDLEVRMKDLLGYTDRVSWLTVKEILTCYATHNIPFPNGVTDEDAERVSHLAGWMWGELYSNDELNRLAIGRFLHEMLDILQPAVLAAAAGAESNAATTAVVDNLNESTNDMVKRPRMLIFSGHDSTLVPVLCALGIYDGNLKAP